MPLLFLGEHEWFCHLHQEQSQQNFPKGSQILLESIFESWGAVGVRGDKLLDQYEMVALFLDPGCVVRRTFHFTEVKTGSASVERLTLKKKKNQKPMTCYAQLKASFPSQNQCSVHCRLTWGEQLTSLDDG